MVLVKAPPGAAESTAPGHIEWEKTVGAMVGAGEVVCRIRFKEDRTLDIKSPVGGIVAVRRKQEGDPVQHGDELFKVRLESSEQLTKKKRKKLAQKDYFEEEEELVGKFSYLGSTKHDKSSLKSSYLSGKESYEIKKGRPQEFVYEVGSNLPQTPPSDEGEKPMAKTILTHSSLIPHPYSQPSTTPISELMTTINEINMESTLKFVNTFGKTYEVIYGNKLSLRSIYIKSAAHALKLNKALNIKLINDERVEGKHIEISIGIRHLKVLVFHTIKEIDKMSYIEISRVIKEIEKQIAAGTYKTERTKRGFTMTSEWEVGSIVGTPSYSKTCTLGLHSIITRPIFEENRITAYPMMYVSLTYDRKTIDDQDAVEYLKVFKQSMEDPRHILVHSS